MHSVLAKAGVRVEMTDLFGLADNRMLDELELPDAYTNRVASLRDLIATHQREIWSRSRVPAATLQDHPTRRR